MKQETLEEAAEKLYPIKFMHFPTNTVDLNEVPRNIFIAGAKWQAKRMYSEEEVIAIVEKSRITGLTAEYLLLTEQFKKK
jgi:Pyruvate/2-oxoacid:ferredoxin oxidoreductase gamma subunit